MKSLAIGSRVTSKAFSYSSSTKKFVGDMSEICQGGIDPLDQLYHDESTKGFVMVSDKTGDQAEFVLYHTEREADGDIRYWLFKPSSMTRIRNKGMENVTAMIVNT